LIIRRAPIAVISKLHMYDIPSVTLSTLASVATIFFP
jgi:hypothetical protein